MIEVGKTYYFKQHAYYHYIGTVTAVLGKGRCAIANVVHVHSCQRDWTSFFDEGCKEDCRLYWVSDKPDFSYLDASEWPHETPRRPHGRGGK